MQNQDLFLKLYNELVPLKKKLASTVTYQKLRFSFEDILGFLDDKIIHVFLKYSETHDYEEMKALAIASLHRARARIYRDYGKELLLEGDAEFSEETPDPELSMDLFMEQLKEILDPTQIPLAMLVLCPPKYILARVENPDKRIPSRLFLEFMGYPVNKKQVKMFNTYRRNLLTHVRRRIPQSSIELSTV